MKKNDLKHFGRLNDPTSAAWTKGICGDEMEFYLFIRENLIEEVKFYTENGCVDTLAAGESTASLAENRVIKEALKMSPAEVIDNADGAIKGEGRHCAILSLITLYKAIADFLIKK